MLGITWTQFLWFNNGNTIPNFLTTRLKITRRLLTQEEDFMTNGIFDSNK